MKKGKNLKRNKRSLRWDKIIICIGVVIITILTISNTVKINNMNNVYMLTDEEKQNIRELVFQSIEAYQSEGAIIEEPVEDEDIITEEITTEETREIDTDVVSRSMQSRREESKELLANSQLYRVTSYYPGDDCSSGITTGSGKTIYDFDTMSVGNHTVYTYRGCVVVAAATKELLNTGYSAYGAQEPQNKYYFSYYETFKILIDDTWYDAIVLDSCGASMWRDEYRIDIFVPDSSNTINRYDVNINVL